MLFMTQRKYGLSDQQVRLKLILGDKGPRAYFPQLNRVFGHQLGLLLSQLAYWEGKQRDNAGLIYKTEKNILVETGLTAANQKYAIRRGKELGIIEMAYYQTPRKRHYKVLWKRVYAILEFEAPKHGLKLLKQHIEPDDIHPTSTPNPHQNTPKTNGLVENIGETARKRVDAAQKAFGKTREQDE
jgi:hypothetical protein